ncbi:MAG TPA: dihydrofolate reductase family protein [Terriglobales bacterium]
MRKIRIFEHMSLDGVIQVSPDENGFPYGDWSGPYRTPEGFAMITAMYGETFDLLLGRRTYDGFSTFWPKAPKSPMADRLNAATKYVLTHRPQSLQWGPFEAIGPDLADSVRGLKKQDGKDLIVTGSSTLTSTLLEHALADEMVLLVDPVFLGTGKRLFAEGTPARSFELVTSRTTPTGIVVNVYKAAGPLKNQT